MMSFAPLPHMTSHRNGPAPKTAFWEIDPALSATVQESLGNVRVD